MVLVGLVGVIALAARPDRALKQWRAQALLEEARDYAGSGEWNEALRTSGASAQLWLTTGAIRVQFDALQQLGHPAALRTGQMLFPRADATADDRFQVLKYLLDAGELVGFVQGLEILNEQEERRSEIQLLKVRFLLAMGRVEEAITLSDSIPAADRGPEADLLLVRALLGNGDSEIRANGLNRLERLLDEVDSQVALAAVRILANQPDSNLPPRVVRKALDRMSGEASLTVDDDLSFLRLRLICDPDQRDSILLDAIQKHHEASLEPLLTRLLQVREPNAVLILTEAAGSLEELTPAIYQSRLEALHRLERYEQLESELKTPPAGMRPAWLYTLQAIAAGHLKKTAAETGYWMQAFEAAELVQSENQFFAIAKVAALGGATEPQMEALTRAIEHPLGIFPPASQLGPLFHWLAETDSERLLSISCLLMQREPNNPILVNNFHYLHCLYDNPTAETLSVMSRLLEAFPQHDSIRGTLALAQFRSELYEEAFATLEEGATPREKLPEGVKVVLAGALFRLGKVAEAEEFAAEIDWGEVYPSEAASLRRLLDSARSGVVEEVSDPEPVESAKSTSAKMKALPPKDFGSRFRIQAPRKSDFLALIAPETGK